MMLSFSTVHVSALCVGSILALGTSAHAQSWLNSPGALGSATITVGHATLRLPPGAWVPVSEGDDVPLQSGGQSLRIQNEYLAQIEGGRLVSILYVRSNATRSGRGWGADRQCRRRDVLFYQNASEWDKTYDCMMVNHSMLALGHNPSDFWAGSYRKLTSLGAMAQPFVCADYALASGSRMDFVSVQVCFNPTTAGFANDGSASWNDSAWNRLHITPDRQGYVQKVVAWAKAYHGTVAHSF